MEGKNKAKKSRGMVREIFTLGVTILALASALLFAFRGARGYGWFVMTKEVDASGMNVKANDVDILQLAREVKVPYDSDGSLPDNVLISFLRSENCDEDEAVTRESEALVFRLTPEGDQEVISPGSCGTMDFWLIPTDMPITQSITVTFELSVKGYHEAGGSGAYFGPSADEYGLVMGHLMFFEGRSGTSGRYIYSNKVGTVSTEAGASSLTYTFQAHIDVNDPLLVSCPFAGQGAVGKQVRLYWVWPQTIGQLTLTDSDPDLVGHSLFSTGDTDSREEVLNELKLLPEYFFVDKNYDPSAVPPVDAVYAPLAGCTDPSDVLLKVKELLSDLDTCYNTADEKIGENVKYIIVKLTASVAVDKN